MHEVETVAAIGPANNTAGEITVIRNGDIVFTSAVGKRRPTALPCEYTNVTFVALRRLR